MTLLINNRILSFCAIFEAFKASLSSWMHSLDFRFQWLVSRSYRDYGFQEVVSWFQSPGLRKLQAYIFFLDFEIEVSLYEEKHPGKKDIRSWSSFRQETENIQLKVKNDWKNKTFNLAFLISSHAMDLSIRSIKHQQQKRISSLSLSALVILKHYNIFMTNWFQLLGNICNEYAKITVTFFG